MQSNKIMAIWSRCLYVSRVRRLRTGDVPQMLNPLSFRWVMGGQINPDAILLKLRSCSTLVVC